LSALTNFGFGVDSGTAFVRAGRIAGYQQTSNKLTRPETSENSCNLRRADVILLVIVDVVTVRCTDSNGEWVNRNFSDPGL
jgi:hypothetical protein